MKDTLVIYHKSDLDGLCCCAIAKKILGDEAEYAGYEYGDSIPDLAPYNLVYLLDISLPREIMAANAGKLCWIDHHKSAMEAMKDLNINGYRVDGVAACRLAWHFFNEWYPGWDILANKEQYVDRKVTEPYAVQLLGEYDIWDKRNPDTDLFQLGMQAEKNPNWTDLFNTFPSQKPVIREGEYKTTWLTSELGWAQMERIIRNGLVIQSYTEVINATLAKERGFDVWFEGLFFRALNTARCSSLTFLAALRPEHDACLGYFWDGDKWKFSFYHAPGKEHHDLSQIAVKYGGGGHRGACGCSMKTLPVGLGS